MKKKVWYVWMLLSIVGMLYSCDEDETMNDEMMVPTKDIVTLAVENGYNSLAAALVRADLVDALKATGPFTVFAPTDEAFYNLLKAIGQKSIDDVPVPVLKDILLYHVLNGMVKSADVSTGNLASLQGSDLVFNIESGIMVNSVMVKSPYDILATNGVIHTIDAVLVPASIAQFVDSSLEPAYFSNDFTDLVSAAVKADLVTTLLEAEALTIFAPTNAAFEASGIDVENTSKESLISVLSYHVIPAKVMSKDIPREATSLEGSKMYFSLSDMGNYINGDIKISAVDIESGKAIIHVLEKVMIPPSGNLVETAVSLSESGEFTSLVAALQRTANEGTAEQNLLTVLSGDGPYTVFAPTNAAFEALLNSNNDWSTLNDIPLETLISVLTYHVVPARAYDKDLAGALDANNQLSTANGAKLTVDLAKLQINTSSNITAVNTNAKNGVIHVIDAVLLP